MLRRALRITSTVLLLTALAMAAPAMATDSASDGQDDQNRKMHSRIDPLG